MEGLLRRRRESSRSAANCWKCCRLNEGKRCCGWRLVIEYCIIGQRYKEKDKSQVVEDFVSLPIPAWVGVSA